MQFCLNGGSEPEATKLSTSIAPLCQHRKMHFGTDTAAIEDIVRVRDVSFRDVQEDAVRAGIMKLRYFNNDDSTDCYLLSAMQLLALPRNGHTRIVPNAAIRVLPFRFVALGAGIYLTDGPRQFSKYIDKQLIAINGVPIEDIISRADAFLAGTSQRQRVIGALMLVWPAALRVLNVCALAERITYALRDEDGHILELQTSQDCTVPALDLYPIREKGYLKQSLALSIAPFESKELAAEVTYIALRDFADTDCRMELEIQLVADAIVHNPHHNLIVDLRGNPGGNFLKALPLLKTVSEAWKGKHCVVLINNLNR
jgi:hypothetical protein